MARLDKASRVVVTIFVSRVLVMLAKSVTAVLKDPHGPASPELRSGFFNYLKKCANELNAKNVDKKLQQPYLKMGM